MFFRKDQCEMSAIYNETSTIPFSIEDSPKSNSEKYSKASSPASGFQRYRASTVIFGLLAAVQLAVIIYLALCIQGSQKALTEERKQLIRTIINIEANNKNVTEEKDELKRVLNDSSLQLNSLTQENDKLKKMNSEIIARSINLTEDRNGLKRKLDDLAQPGWRIFRQSAYYMSTTTKTWQKSRDHCRSLGADLMIINSKEEQVFANSFKKYMWIGLTDSEGEGRWKWVDGTPLNTNYWSENEPNGKTEENCGDIKSFETERSWNDESCSHNLNWICEMKLNQ